MTRSADLEPGKAELQTGLVTLRGSQLVSRTSTSAAERGTVISGSAGSILARVEIRGLRTSRRKTARTAR
jgi:hypothetical protein